MVGILLGLSFFIISYYGLGKPGEAATVEVANFLFMWYAFWTALSVSVYLFKSSCNYFDLAHQIKRMPLGFRFFSFLGWALTTILICGALIAIRILWLGGSYMLMISTEPGVPFAEFDLQMFFAGLFTLMVGGFLYFYSKSTTVVQVREKE